MGLAVLTVAAFAGVWTFDFVKLDDPIYILQNPGIQNGLTWAGVRWAFATTYAANWHPLTWIAHMLDISLFGLRPGPFHAVNLLLHVVNVLLLFGVLTAATRAVGRSAFVAALFAVHPLHVESVAWIAERKDVLSTLFWLLTMAAWIGYVRRPDWRRYVLVAATFAAGLLAKPMLVTLPLVLLLFDVWPLGRLDLENGSLGRTARAFGRLLLEKTPLLVLSALSSIATFIAQHRAGAVMSLERMPMDARVFNALVSYAAYVGKMLAPVNLFMFYPHATTFRPWEVLGSAAALLAATGLAVVLARRRPYVAVGWFWYLGTLVPVIGLVQVGRQAMADRYTYVPLIGLFIIVAWGAVDLARSRAWTTRWLPAVAAALVATCGVLTWMQVRHWRDDRALWSHALHSAIDLDEHRTRLAVADLLEEESVKVLQALLETRQSVSALAAAKGRDYLGQVFLRHRQTAEAIQSFMEAIEMAPESGQFRADLGVAYATQGRTDAAIAEYREALRLDPDLGETHNDLGIALVRLGRNEEALPHFARAAALLPDSPDPRRNLGLALVNAGRLAEALVAFRDVLHLKPDDTAVQQALDEITARLKGGSGGGR